MVNRSSSMRKPAYGPRKLRRIIDRLERGYQIVPNPDPPSFSRAPWWPLTILYAVKPGADDLTYTSDICNTVATRILKNTGSSVPILNLAKQIIFKVQSVRLWGLDKQMINMDVPEIVGEKRLSMVQLADTGSGMQFSRLGYRYGSVSRIDPLQYDEATVVCEVRIPDNTKAVTYIQILWSMKTAEAANLLTADPICYDRKIRTLPDHDFEIVA